MKRGRFSEEQIIAVLKEAESGAKVSELGRRHGISDATFYNWRSRYGGPQVSFLCLSGDPVEIGEYAAH